MNISRCIISILFIVLTGCGGGGGSGQTVAHTVVNGTASKGLISGGTVTVFALNANGSKGTLLGQDITKSDGSYSINIGSYVGPVTAEVSGSYTDEATGQTKTVPSSAPLRAAIGIANGNVSLAVTPLTELAVRQAGLLTAQNITAANTLISDMFKVDIINTLPVAPTASAFLASQTSQAQKDYTIALAAISQQMKTTGSDLSSTLSALNSGISSSGMSSQTAEAITSAINTYIGTPANPNPANQTGITSIASTSLQAVGSTTKILTLSLGGNSASLVKGIQATITFPSNAALRADASGELFASVLATTGSAGSSFLAGKFVSATALTPALLNLGLITTGSLAAGDVITINADIAAGSASPAASAFVITGSTLVDANGVTVNSASIAIK